MLITRQVLHLLLLFVIVTARKDKIENKNAFLSRGVIHPKNRQIESDRIFGGVGTTIDLYPFQVSVQFGGSHICGGSIISEKWVLTAAHCLEGVTPRYLSIRAGSTYKDYFGEIYAVKNIISHPKYNSLDYDYGLILIQKSFNFSNKINKVSLASKGQDFPTGTQCTITGWGYKILDYDSQQLQVINSTLISNSRCRRYYAASITNRMICAHSYGKDACVGDSGGPMIAENVLAGIVSFGPSLCGDTSAPGVYARVSDQIDWIRQTCQC